MTGYGDGFGDGYDVEELPLVSFGGRRLIILKQPKIEVVRVFTALRIKSALTTDNVSKIHIKSRLGGRLTATINIKSALKSITESQIIMKSSLKTRINQIFMVKGVQGYSKFFDMVKIIEMLD